MYDLRLSDPAMKKLKVLEGWRSEAYRDVAGVLTIGWGRTEAVKSGDRTTPQWEEAWIVKRTTYIAQQIAKVLRVELTQAQFDALILFAYNVGLGAFRHSTLLKVINAMDFDSVPEQFARWVHAGGKVVKGLEYRRAQELRIWHGDY